MKYFSIGIYKALAFSSALFLMGCGSDSSEPVSNEPVTVLECPTSDSLSRAEPDDACMIAGPDNPSEPENTPQIVALETELTAEIKEGENIIYKIDTGANVSLFSTSGDANLFLFDEVEDIDMDNLYSNEKLLCGSWWEFKEDVCDEITTEDGDLYAMVVGYSDATYRLGATAECSVESVNKWVYRSMLDYYIYADNVPVIDPGTYTDSSDLVEALRFEELDDFSSIGDATATTKFFEEGLQFGLGFSWRRDDNDDLRIRYTFKDSPFGRAGIKRGDIAISINAELIDGMSNERFDELLGTDENPLSATWEFVDGETGETKTASIISAEFRLNTVLFSEVYTNPTFAGNIGYIVFKQFIDPSVAELDLVISQFKERGVTELVLDLRYNGGGRSRVGRNFASQLAGSVVDGKLQMRDEHNSKYSSSDYERFFSETMPSLDLSRLVVLTGYGTASASERLISSLRPYIEVVTIGSTTRGKAFSSNSRKYCGKSLSAMQTQGVNAAGVSVAGGISADCYAADDTANGFGLNEGMLKSAIDYTINGTCEFEPIIAARSTAAQNSESAESNTPILAGQEMLDSVLDD